MKIIYTISSTFNSGGMERVLATKANYLARIGHEVFIVTTDQEGKKPYFELDPRIEQIDLSINYSLDTTRGLLERLILYPLKQRKHKQRLTACLKRLMADVVISMFDHDASFLYQIKDRSKKVLEVHFSRYKRLQYGRTGLIGWIDRFRSKNDLFIARRYDRFVVLTEEDKLYWGNLRNLEVIPNANSFVPNSIALVTEKRVIAVGRLAYQKGFDDLIRAWKIVHAQQPDWILSIYGNGPLESHLLRLVNELELNSVIQLCPPVEDIEKEYLNSSILVMTSRYEGLPMVLLEGQACGLPLISYACKCGPRDIIEDGVNGYLIEEGNIGCLAQRLILLMGRPDLRIQMSIQSKIKSNNYTEELIMTRWLNLFQSLISQMP